MISSGLLEVNNQCSALCFVFSLVRQFNSDSVSWKIKRSHTKAANLITDAFFSPLVNAELWFLFVSLSISAYPCIIPCDY